MKTSQILVGLVVLAAVAVGGYFLLHKSSSTNPTTSGQIIQTKTDTKLGSYLADSSGKPLYTYAKDTSGVSNCSGSCLSNWPAYTATTTGSLPAHVGTITRSDGSKQYTYDGLPLYTFTGDTGGSVTGDGVEDFHIAKPASAASSPSTAPSTSSPAPAQSTPSTPSYNY